MAKQKIFKTGNSLAITVPARFAEVLGIKSGQSASVKTDPEQGRLVVHFSGSNQLRLVERKAEKVPKVPKVPKVSKGR